MLQMDEMFNVHHSTHQLTMNLLCCFAGKFEVCPNGWSFLQGECFKNIESDTSMSWDKARIQCKILGGDLASVKDNETQNFLFTLLDPGIKKAWIGGRKIGGQWSWVDGTPFDWTEGWHRHQPSGDGSYMELINWNSAEKGWNDLPSYTDQKRHILCKLGMEIWNTV